MDLFIAMNEKSKKKQLGADKKKQCNLIEKIDSEKIFFCFFFCYNWEKKNIFLQFE